MIFLYHNQVNLPPPSGEVKNDCNCACIHTLCLCGVEGYNITYLQPEVAQVGCLLVGSSEHGKSYFVP
jgi:hypothetical protein